MPFPGLPTGDLQAWLAAHGITNLYMGEKTDNPTAAPGAILLSVTAPFDVWIRGAVILNDSACSMTFVLEIDYDDGEGWIRDGAIVLPPHFPASLDFPALTLTSGQSIRVGVEENADATGQSFVALSYFQAAS